MKCCICLTFWSIINQINLNHIIPSTWVMPRTCNKLVNGVSHPYPTALTHVAGSTFSQAKWWTHDGVGSRVTYVFSDNRKSSWDFWQVPLSFIWQKRCFLSFPFSIFTDRLQELSKKHYGVMTVMSEYIGVHLFYFVYLVYIIWVSRTTFCVGEHMQDLKNTAMSLSFLSVLQEILADGGHPTGIACLRMFEDIAYCRATSVFWGRVNFGYLSRWCLQSQKYGASHGIWSTI